MNKFLKVFVLLFNLTLILKAGDTALENELKLKAVYLIRLTDFTTFPSNIEQKRLNICVDGRSPIISFLNEIDLDKNKKYITVLYDISHDLINGCNILYLSEKESGALDKKLETLADSKILTISSIHGFADSGGMIEFYVDNNKVRMRVNLSVLRKTGIFINPKVLKLMSIVKR